MGIGVTLMFNFRNLIDAVSKVSPAPVRPVRGHAHTPMPTPVREEWGAEEEEDEEGEMASTQLKTIEEKAAAISSMLKPESKLEPWVQSKITLAEDYISTVHDYLKNTPGAIGESAAPVEEGAVKAEMEDWIESLPKTVVSNLRNQYGAILKSGDQRKLNDIRKGVNRILKQGNVKPLMGSMRDSVDAILMSFDTYHG
jgi:hypothetical protein